MQLVAKSEGKEINQYCRTENGNKTKRKFYISKTRPRHKTIKNLEGVRGYKQVKWTING